MTRLARPCLTCGAITRHGSRCPNCTARQERKRGTTTQRGYGSDWQARSRHITRLVGRCEACGAEHTATNPLTLDHVIAKARGGTDDLVQVLCRRCNSAKGASAA